MNNKKGTRRALLTSVMALAMCVVMLIGTTFAWFTDTATAKVNQIKSGTLDVALEVGDAADGADVTHWEPLAEGSYISFLKSNGNGVKQSEDILWEPGCTYSLPALKIINNGNLALKYKIQITGIQGSAKLNEVIDWTIENDGTAYDVDKEYKLPANTNSGDNFDILTISGHMQETANNDYQDLTIEGIGITVYATQDTVEFDSTTNRYDERSEYNYTAVNEAGLRSNLLNGGNILLGTDVTASAPLVVKKAATLDMNGKTIDNTDDIWNDNDNSWGLVSARDTAELTITGNGTFQAKENDCYAVDVQDAGAKVIIENGKFVGNISAVYVYEGTALIKGGFFDIQQKNGNGVQDEYGLVLNCYDANYQNGTAKIIVTGGTFVNFDPADCAAEGDHTSFVPTGYTVESATQSNGDIWYTVVPAAGAVAMISSDSVSRYTLAEAVEKAQSGDTVTLMDDAAVSGKITVAKDLTIDGNGHTVTRSDGYTATLFAVGSTGSLELKDLTIDAGAKWSYNETVWKEMKALSDRGTDVRIDVEGRYTSDKGATYSSDSLFAFDAGHVRSTGDMFVVNSGNLVLTDTTITNFYSALADNRARIAALYGNAKLTVNNSTVSHCALINCHGGPFYHEEFDAGAEFVWNGLTFTDCFGNRNGGVLYTVVGSKTTINNCNISNNRFISSIGFVAFCAGELTMNNGTIQNNVVLGTGAAFNSRNTNAFVMNGGSITGNDLGNGQGGVMTLYRPNNLTNGCVKINGGTITGNTVRRTDFPNLEIVAGVNDVIGANATVGDLYVGGRPGANIEINGTVSGNLHYYRADATITGTGTVEGNVYLKNGATWAASGITVKGSVINLDATTGG